MIAMMIQCASGRVGLSYAKFLPKDTEWEGSFEVFWSIYQAKKHILFAQVRKKTLLNKEEIACSEVIPLPSHSSVLIPGSKLFLSILCAELGGQRGRLSLGLVQVSISEQSGKRWHISYNLAVTLPSTGSIPVHGSRMSPTIRMPCQRPFWWAFHSHLSPIFQARWLKLSEMTGCMPLCSVRFLFTHYLVFSH